MDRNWTLTADMTAGALAVAVAEKLPGQIQPGITAGRLVTVTVRGGAEPPTWMVDLQRERPDDGIVID